MSADSLCYIMDYSGNYFRVNKADQLVVAAGEKEATVFTYAQANSRVCVGKKSSFYCMIPIEEEREIEMSCELLFIEIVAVGFLGIASVLFKEKQMGVIRVHAVLPLKKSLFILSKLAVFLVSDLVFAVLLTLLNVGFFDTIHILPAVLVQTAILSLIMALMGFGCTMLLNDFKQFSLAYLIIALFVATPIFLSANTSIKMAWIDWHPFYQVYMGLKNAYFGVPVTSPVYYICSACGIAVLFVIVQTAFHKEMGKEG